MSIDNSSIFVAGGVPQNGFRRTDLIAAVDGQHDVLITQMESGTTAFHFSVMADESRPLNYSHEYQVVFVEPNDGSHVFDLQLGASPGRDRSHLLPVLRRTARRVPVHEPDGRAAGGERALVQGARPRAERAVRDAVRAARVAQLRGRGRLGRAHARGVLLGERGAARAREEHDREPDRRRGRGRTGRLPLRRAQGACVRPAARRRERSWLGLQLPLVNPADSAADQNDVVHYGIQEGTTEALLYSGVFVESTANGISKGLGIVN